jgi:hypothetical protein
MMVNDDCTINVLHLSLKPKLASSITIVSDAPNCGVNYDHHYDDRNSFIIQATDCLHLTVKYLGIVNLINTNCKAYVII